jgi:predicted negative regulator of RcsB-dependent stress response
LAGQRLKHTHRLQALVALADLSLQAERASAAGRHDDAIRLARAAVAREDALDFDEPPAWHAPTRRLLGDVLARAGRRDEAAAAYRAELHRRPATAEVAHALDRLRAGRGGS